MSKKRKTEITLYIFLLLITNLCLITYYQFSLKLVEVPVSRYVLNGRTLIEEESIEYIKIPKAYLSEDVYTDKGEIINKYVNNGHSIPQGSYFYKTAIKEIDNSKDSFYSELREGEVAYDLFMNEISVNEAKLLKGMNVDIYLTINKKVLVSDLFIKNARIIGLYDLNNKEIKDYDKEARLYCLTLAVPEDTVIYLNKAKSVGDLSLIITANTYSEVECILNKSSILSYLE
ncbi:MAG: hypothetical protein Q4B60_05510 [Erysipelotrichaceae bacterium]|nr:hypothetical protein [Erysipelotrichaceae bacterium]